MYVFIGNFTYIIDFMIVENISSLIDPGLSQVVTRKPFTKRSNMTHDPPEGVHTKLVYLGNEDDKRRGAEYVMSKILGFYKKCLELGPEYVTGMDDEGEVTTIGIQKPGHLAARLGCAETKVATWDDLAFKLITLGKNVKH
nr:protein kinase-like domain, concanavalin A-like lectin/glucanase domain protein [Tanacetum cinerariifolium]